MHGTEDGFNPHPPLLAGETHAPERFDLIDFVSIHTRHYWRVKQGMQALGDEWLRVSIHTRHYWRVKRQKPRRRLRKQCFNPHPPLLAGETRAAAAGTKRSASFNPHPPLLAGETSRQRSIPRR